MATNRPDTLDPALARPGRLDRKIEFPLPDRRQKRLVFQALTSKMNLSEEVDLDDKYTWRSPDNLPRGWKVRRKLSRSRKMIEFFLTPDGKMLRGKAAAMAHMATQGASPGDVVTMR